LKQLQATLRPGVSRPADNCVFRLSSASPEIKVQDRGRWDKPGDATRAVIHIDWKPLQYLDRDIY
jgi:hypothetical protein